MRKGFRLLPIFLILGALLFIILTFAIPGLYEAKVLSLTTDIDSHLKLLEADVIWGGTEYKVAYCISDGTQTTIPPISYNRNIYWASLDAEGNPLETAPLINDPDFSAEHPTLLYTGVDYILLWVQSDPAPSFSKLHATIIDKDGNTVHDKIISYWIPHWDEFLTALPRKYAAVWDIKEEALYIVYAESNPRFKFTKERGTLLPPEKLVFSKLYRANNQLHFVTFYDEYMLTRKKLLVPLGPVFMWVAMVKTENHLAVVVDVSPPVPFLLLNHKGDIIKKDATLFGANNYYPSLHWEGGEGIILGYVDYNDWKYKIKKLLTDDPNSITLQGTAEITNITIWDNATLLRKDNGHLSLVWKDPINQDKAIYTIGYDENLNEIVPIQPLKPPYNIVNLSDYYLANGTGENAEFALVYTREYGWTTLNLLRFNYIYDFSKASKSIKTVTSDKTKDFKIKSTKDLKPTKTW